MQKRAQVTVFIILGIIIIAVIVGIAFFYGDRIQNFTRPGVLDSSSLEPLKSFVASCMKESVSSDLELLKKNSGYFTKISSTVVYSGYEINAIVDKSLNSPNNMNSKAGIENEISRHVENEIVNNFDLNDFNFDIVKGDAKADTEIRDSSIVVTVNYPLTVSKGETSLTLNDFSLIVDDDFGKIYDAVNDIVNAEVQGEFDMNDYFLENKDVTVTRTDADNGLIYRIVTNKEEEGFVFGVKNE